MKVGEKTLRLGPLGANANFSMRGVSSLLDRAVDSCFLAILFLAPLVMGGRHPAGRLVYVALISLALLIWTIRQGVDPNARLHRSGAEWLILCGLGILILQLVRLPQSWLTTLSPNLPHLLPLWFRDSASGWDSWTQLSLCPGATRDALVMYLAYAALFLLVIQRIKSIEDVERFLRWIALAVIGLCALGIFQMLLSNGKFLWVYEHPSRDTYKTVKGPFANENHFAHFVALGIGPIVWWLWRQMFTRNKAEKSQSRKRSRQPSLWGRQSTNRFRIQEKGATSFSLSRHRPQEYVQTLLWFALPIVAIAGLLTFSRGGVIVIFVATSFTLASSLALRLFGRRSLFALAGLGVVVITALFIYGFDQLSGEIESVTSGSFEDLDRNAARRKLWAADLKAFRDFAVLGTGAATHREVYPTYYTDYHAVEYTHAESGYIQILMETGTVGFCVLLSAISLCVLWSWRCLRAGNEKRVRAIAVALLAGMVASLVHSIWDFVWYIPACITLTIVLVACLCRLSQLCAARQEVAQTMPRRHLPAEWNEAASISGGRTAAKSRGKYRFGWVFAASIVAIACFQLVKVLLPAARAAPSWDQYASMVFATKQISDSDDARQAILAAISDLDTASQLDPRNPRVSLKLAALCLYQFEVAQQSSQNPIALDQLRQVVAASAFPNVEQQNRWLVTAIGENSALLFRARYFARRAAHLSPLQGEAYIHLARLEFLNGADSNSSSELVQAALRTRPNHGGVLITAAADSALAGNTEAALQYFRRAFQQGAKYRKQVIEILGDNLTPALFLEELQPDLDGLRQLFGYYRGTGRREEGESIARPYLDRLESAAAREFGKVAAKLWYEAHAAYDYLDDRKSMLACLQHAINHAPDDYHLRHVFAGKLLAHGSPEAAIREIRWCLYRRPDDPGLKRMMVNANRKKLNESRVADARDGNAVASH